MDPSVRLGFLGRMMRNKIDPSKLDSDIEKNLYLEFKGLSDKKKKETYEKLKKERAEFINSVS